MFAWDGVKNAHVPSYDFKLMYFVDSRGIVRNVVVMSDRLGSEGKEQIRNAAQKSLFFPSDVQERRGYDYRRSRLYVITIVSFIRYHERNQ